MNTAAFHSVPEFRKTLFLMTLLFFLFIPAKGLCDVDGLCANEDGRFVLPDLPSKPSNTPEERAMLWAEGVKRVSGYKTGQTKESAFLNDGWEPHRLWGGRIGIVSLSSDAKTMKSNYVLGISLINKFSGYELAGNIVGKKMLEDMFSELTTMYCKYLKERDKPSSFHVPIPKWKTGDESTLKPLYILNFQDGVLAGVKTVN